jgi:hypothetical protein
MTRQSNQDQADNPVNPVDAVKESSPTEVAALAARLADSGRAAGFQVEVFGKAAGVPLLALTRPATGPCPRLYLSAGIHGDEPAPSQALLQLLEQGFFDGRCRWFLCPLLNPAGLARGTLENPDGRDHGRGSVSAKLPVSIQLIGGKLPGALRRPMLTASSGQFPVVGQFV